MLHDWRPNARTCNNAVIDRMVNAIHMVVDMRAQDTAEDTITLALAEKIELITNRIEGTYKGTMAEEEEP